jgi:hypothetical protein
MAAKLVDDEAYRKNLIVRLRAGLCAPALEVLLWQFAYGKPLDEIVIHDDRSFKDMSLEQIHARLRAIADEAASLVAPPRTH